MASFLEGQLSKAIARGFKGRLLKGRIERAGSGGGVDEFGDSLPSGTVSFSFEGFVDAYSVFTRSQAGIPDTDAKICILGASIRPVTVPQKDDRVFIGGKTFTLVRQTNRDPASAIYEMQGMQIDGNE